MNNIKNILTILFLTFSILSFSQNKTTEEMEWLTTNTEYEGLPLYLRIPNYKNVWKFKSKYQKLICITHKLNSVNNNGLPTEEYNQLLIDFDNDAVNLFDRNKNGIVFLVETYEGERNYWFYIVDSKFFFKSFEELKKKHSDKKLELDFRNDIDWNFIKDYPVELYPSN